MAKLRQLLALLLVASVTWLAAADEESHRYKEQEEVILWVNKVGPYNNPQETYAYYTLPFCKPQGKALRKKSEGLGAVLEGNELVDSGIQIRFRENIPSLKVCDIVLGPHIQSEFVQAVRHHYWYQLFIDELPVWGMVGIMMQPEQATDGGAAGGGEQAFLYSHREFVIAYNEDRIIEVNLTSKSPLPLKVGSTIPMTVSVQWEPTSKTFENRFDRYLDFEFFEHQIHWFYIMNSFMLVVFLCGIVVLILMRTLKNDYIRYAQEEEEMDIDRVTDESGWKQVHGDVFRAPANLMLLSALIGTGSQLLLLVLVVILLAIAGSLYMSRGAILSSFLIAYSFTSILSGYFGGRHYKRYGGTEWKMCMALTAVLFPGVSFGIAFLVNFVAVAYQSLAAISFVSMLVVFGIWALISVPLVIFGTIVGRNTAAKDEFPCRVLATRRPIPHNPWYLSPYFLTLAGGVMPFGSIFIEMYFVFTSVWNYKYYYVYGFMLIVYFILIIITVCVNVVTTYLLLNAEDPRWQWTSFFSGGSAASYTFLYAVYFFFAKTKMTGFLQICFYFGYSAIFCFGLFILCGTLSYLGSSVFVHKIYSYIKMD